MSVIFQNCQPLPLNLRWLRRLARTVLRSEGLPAQAEVGVLLTDDKTITALNTRYRGANTPTDVLAFGADGDDTGLPAPSLCPLGDVIISVETAARHARQEDTSSLDKEVGFLLAHGLLHLSGWRDDTPAQRAAMLTRQAELVAEAERTVSR